MMPSINSITFDTSELNSYRATATERIWHTTAGDGIGLYYFPTKPDIPTDISRLSDLRGFYRKAITPGAAALIELDTIKVDGCNGLWLLIKHPQQPNGMTYVGSLTLPFRDFSFVIKVQCIEQGITGIRDSIVLDRALADGRVTIGAEDRLEGWWQDPYDPTYNAPVLRNLSDHEQYDDEFPQHPLSRARSLMRHIRRTLSVATEVKAAAPHAFFLAIK